MQEDHGIFNNAADLVRAIPDQQNFTLGMALACCGADNSVSQSTDMQKQLQNLLDYRARQHGAPYFLFTEDDITARAKVIASNSKCLPRNWKHIVLTNQMAPCSGHNLDLHLVMSEAGGSLDKADILRLAAYTTGANENQVKGGKLNMRSWK